MKILAIIPARGGSKQLPGKNLSPLCGKPLIDWTIEQARDSKLVTHVVVSTDDEAIRLAALLAGADVIMRPAELAGDHAPSEWALEHVLENIDYEPDIVVMLQATSPIRRPEDIDRAVLMVLSGYDSVLSCVRLHQFVWRDSDNGSWAVNYNPIAMRPMRQSVDDFIENGSIYVFDPWVLKQHKTRLGGKIGIYEQPYPCRFEIDTQDDLELIEWIMRGGLGWTNG